MSPEYKASRQGYTARPHKEQIRLAMEFKRWTNADLAFKAKISPSTVGNILGKRATCSPRTAGKIAEALGVEKTEKLFTLEEIKYAA